MKVAKNIIEKQLNEKLGVDNIQEQFKLKIEAKQEEIF